MHVFVIRPHERSGQRLNLVLSAAAFWRDCLAQQPALIQPIMSSRSRARSIASDMHGFTSGSASSKASSTASHRIVACGTFGTNNFKGCKFCRRPRSTPNPIKAKQAQIPLLPFRSERHAECNMCAEAT